jgi:uncharacterized protein YbbC (DUF1343 family)
MTVRLGLEVLLESLPDRIGGGRVGLVASPSSVDRNLTGVVERLWRAPGVRLPAGLGPAPGLRGRAPAGDHVEPGRPRGRACRPTACTASLKDRPRTCCATWT